MTLLLGAIWGNDKGDINITNWDNNCYNCGELLVTRRIQAAKNIFEWLQDPFIRIIWLLKN